MLANLAACYPWMMIVMIFAILIWFLRDELQRSNVTTMLVFGIAAILYFPALFACDGSLFAKLGHVVRDLVTLCAMIWIGDHLKKGLHFGLVGGLLGLACLTFYHDYLERIVPAGVSGGAATSLALASDGEFLIDIAAEGNIDELTDSLSKYGVTINPAFPNLKHPEYSDLNEYYTLDVPDGQLRNLGAIKSILAGSKHVDFVEGNDVFTLSPLETKPTATESPRRGGVTINDPEASQQWSLTKLSIEECHAWLAEQTPKKQALVAVLDTGVDAGHEDLQDNYVSTDAKHDRDALGHGTHCAGVASAVTGNGIGVASINDGRFVKVTSIKVLSDNGSGSEQTIIAGIIEAADSGADVISLSLGGPATKEKQRAEEEAIKYATKSGAVVIAAAGNAGGDARDAAPACCEGVIAVAALDSNLKMAEFSNEVSGIAMAVSAPGVEIHSTIPGNKYASYSGTSMATPLVAGLSGILKSLNPDLSATDLHRILTQTGTTTSAGERSGPLIQPLAAMKAAAKGSASIAGID